MDGQQINAAGEAAVPPPASVIPPPPGMTDAEWETFRHRWHHAVHEPARFIPAQRSTVDVTGATEALVVGPSDVLIISFPEHVEMDELYTMRDRLRDSDLRDGQILLIAGATKMVKVEGDDAPQRPYVRPQATIEGQAD